jgi:hypothetical protein
MATKAIATLHQAVQIYGSELQFRRAFQITRDAGPPARSPAARVRWEIR